MIFEFIVKVEGGEAGRIQAHDVMRGEEIRRLDVVTFDGEPIPAAILSGRVLREKPDDYPAAIWEVQE